MFVLLVKRAEPFCVKNQRCSSCIRAIYKRKIRRDLSKTCLIVSPEYTVTNAQFVPS